MLRRVMYETSSEENPEIRKAIINLRKGTYFIDAELSGPVIYPYFCGFLTTNEFKDSIDHNTVFNIPREISADGTIAHKTPVRFNIISILDVFYGLEIVNPHKVTKVELYIGGGLISTVNNPPSVINIVDLFAGACNFIFATSDGHFLFYGDFDILTIFSKQRVLNISQYSNFRNQQHMILFDQRFTLQADRNKFKLHAIYDLEFSTMEIQTSIENTKNVYGVNIYYSNHVTSVLPSELKKENNTIKFEIPLYLKNNNDYLEFEILGIDELPITINIGMYNILRFNSDGYNILHNNKVTIS